jgi:probable F420-dependent oxidoreductase
MPDPENPLPFRFIADIRTVADARTIGERARRAEAAGYDALVLTDHLGYDQLAPMPGLAVAAAATERLRIGTFVLNNDLRHPAVLAQDLASLDVLSGGRLDIGIGAGWNRPEYAATGIAFEPGWRRVQRLEEAVAVLKGLFGGGPFSFEGRHYRISELSGLPLPVQRPHPRLLIGGGGPRLLALAGREADVVGLSPRAGSTARRDLGSFLAPAAGEKLRQVREAAGDRFRDLEINTYPALSGDVVVTDQPGRALAELAARLQERFGVLVTEDELRESPHCFIGTVDDLADQLRMLRRRFGISSLMVGDPDDRVTPLVERLAGT